MEIHGFNMKMRERVCEIFQKLTRGGVLISSGGLEKIPKINKRPPCLLGTVEYVQCCDVKTYRLVYNFSRKRFLQMLLSVCDTVYHVYIPWLRVFNILRHKSAHNLCS